MVDIGACVVEALHPIEHGNMASDLGRCKIDEGRDSCEVFTPT